MDIIDEMIAELYDESVSVGHMSGDDITKRYIEVYGQHEYAILREKWNRPEGAQ